MSAWSCWERTERHMSRRRACRWGEPEPSGIGGSSAQGRSRTCHSWRFASSYMRKTPAYSSRSSPGISSSCVLIARAYRRVRRVPAVKRWPRKNDPVSIRARQEALSVDGEVFAHDLEPFAKAQEMLTGAAMIPVAVVPVNVEVGEYELEEPFGRLVETGRTRDLVHVPLAHT